MAASKIHGYGQGGSGSSRQTALLRLRGPSRAVR